MLEAAVAEPPKQEGAKEPPVDRWETGTPKALSRWFHRVRKPPSPNGASGSVGPKLPKTFSQIRTAELSEQCACSRRTRLRLSAATDRMAVPDASGENGWSLGSDKSQRRTDSNSLGPRDIVNPMSSRAAVRGQSHERHKYIIARRRMRGMRVEASVSMQRACSPAARGRPLEQPRPTEGVEGEEASPRSEGKSAAGADAAREGRGDGNPRSGGT